MSKQPKPLQLADECMESANCWANEIDTRIKAAAELRRLHAVNQEMLEALKLAFPSINPKAIDGRRAQDNPIDECYVNTIVRKVIKKAEETV